MNRAFFLDILRRKPALFQAMLAFNAEGSPSASGLADVLTQAVPGIDAGMLLASADVRRRLAALCPAGAPGDTAAGAPGHGATGSTSGNTSGNTLNSTFGPDTAASGERASEATAPGAPRVPFWDFAEESRRLALLPAPAVDRLALTFGAALHGNAFAVLVRRDDVLALRTALGEDLYAYGLHRGRYQLGGVRRHFSPLRDAERTGEGIARRIRTDGLTALGVCIARWPDVLRRRLVWPDSMSGISSGNTPDDITADIISGTSPRWDEARRQAAWPDIWFSLRKLLLKEVAPQWAPCFD
ncbi:SctK family type III secretion system sorting platform protein [Nitratidesulfovibrio vulgaris]|uniref:Uncharacterized protein n=1 Tax=Nitratidesulfovibrio vulgaris (strain DP4) TaxID=391774 RepID=A0A0H3ACF5_NITV4|nr:SctK family type III secretion system sorting platform protein [Nitratidesulfovibrio vulgaris]ABM30001.1 hypothetical protein Dvul_2990 [Nitratidesulfovibrio vulgaris DP4]